MNSTNPDLNITPEDRQVHIVNSVKSIFQYQGFQVVLRSLQSLLDLVGRKGDPDKSVIFYTDNSIFAVLDDTVQDRKQDTATYRVEFSPAWQEWANVLDGVQNQKSFLKFLKLRPEGELPGIEDLISSVSNLVVGTVIDGKFGYEDDNNLSVMFKIGDKEGSTTIPKTLTAVLSLFRESNFLQEIEFELEFIKPKGENEKPVFRITCPKFERYHREAWDEQIETLKTELDGYLILAGTA